MFFIHLQDDLPQQLGLKSQWLKNGIAAYTIKGSFILSVILGKQD